MPLDGQQVDVASGAEARLRVYGREGLAEVYGIARPLAAVRDSDTETYADFLAHAIADTTLLADYRAAIESPRRPNLLPAYDRVLVADDGDVWAERYAVDPDAVRTWEVFGPDREWLGRVETPVRFHALAVAAGRILGVWRDSMDVEYVRAYELRR